MIESEIFPLTKYAVSCKQQQEIPDKARMTPIMMRIITSGSQ